MGRKKEKLKYIEYDASIKHFNIHPDVIRDAFITKTKDECKDYLYYTFRFLLTGEIPSEAEDYEEEIRNKYKKLFKSLQKHTVIDEVSVKPTQAPQLQTACSNSNAYGREPTVEDLPF